MPGGKIFSAGRSKLGHLLQKRRCRMLFLIHDFHIKCHHLNAYWWARYLYLLMSTRATTSYLLLLAIVFLIAICTLWCRFSWIFLSNQSFFLNEEVILQSSKWFFWVWNLNWIISTGCFVSYWDFWEGLESIHGLTFWSLRRLGNLLL